MYVFYLIVGLFPAHRVIKKTPTQFKKKVKNSLLNNILITDEINVNKMKLNINSVKNKKRGVSYEWKFDFNCRR